MDRHAIQQAAQLFIGARRSGRLLDALPAACRPATADDAHAIQAATVAGLGETVGGWKVGAPIQGKLVRGVIMRSVIFESPARVEAARMPLLGVEAEIAFRFERDMPPRSRAYAYDEVAAAVTAFAAIEIVDSRFRSYGETPLLDRAADCVSNGGFVCGSSQRGWRSLDLSNLEVVLAIGGTETVRRVGGHAAGDPLLPAVALVNDLGGGGLLAGQIVTTGTCTGLNFAMPGQAVAVAFAGLGEAQVLFAR
jgi:2-keto-4-pentenoate hydratase